MHDSATSKAKSKISVEPECDPQPDFDRHVSEEDMIFLEDENDHFPLRSIDRYTRQFVKLSRRVCLIQRDDGGESTGFLVGPDLMMTAAHTLMGTSGVFAHPCEVTVLFDQFIWNAKTGTKAYGDRCRLRRIPFTNQPDVVASSIKVNQRSTRVLKDNELDYMLVRLDRPIGLMFLPFSHRIRGWNDVSRAEIPPSGPVSVVQHPEGGLQKFADGVVTPNDVKLKFPQFFTYETTTLNGSSGSPIVDSGKRVVGIHIGQTSPNQQLGISFQKVFKDLERENVKLPPFRLSKECMDSIFGSSDRARNRKPGMDWRGDRLFPGDA